MWFQNKITRKYYRYLTVCLLCSGCFLLSPIAVRGSQKNGQNKIDFASPAKSERVATSSFQVLPATINLIKQHEGFRPHAYIDTSGLPVIGYGQTRINGRTVTMGQYITPAEANASLQRELAQIQSLVLNSVKVDLNPHQLGALTSLVYNAGMRVVTRSTLSRKLNAGDFAGAAKEFTRWNKANQGGQLVEFPGLTRRRIDEQKLFLTPAY